MTTKKKKTPAKKKTAPRSRARARVATQQVSHAEGDSAAVWFPWKRLIPWADNPRHNDGEPPERIADTIQALGWGRTVVARPDPLELIAGHTTVKAVRVLVKRWKVASEEDRSNPEVWHPEAVFVVKSGLIPVRFGDWTEEQAHKLAVADNRTGEFSRWDVAKLDQVLARFDPSTPEFEQPDVGSYRRVIVHFACREDVAAFEQLIGQRFTEKTKSVWYPKQERRDETSNHYAGEG